MCKKTKFGFIGTGAWSSALANVLSHNDYQSMLYGIDQNEIQDIAKGFNTKYFSSREFFNHENIFVTNKLSELIKFSDVIVLGIPSQFVQSVLKELQNELKYKKIDLINLSKGFEPNSEKPFSEFIKKKFKRNLKNLATFIGPSFAVEVFNEQFTTINVVGENVEYINSLTKAFNNNFFNLVPEQNEVGAEIFAAIKNVLAIGMGIISIIYESINTNAALLTMGIQEISKIVKELNPNVNNSEVAMSFAGIGDVFLTCSSTKSRNYRFGQQIAEIGLEKTLEENSRTVEGIETAKTLAKILKKHDIDVPFLKNILSIISGQKNPLKILDFIKN
ncbi:NAD(P)H-dependent glycerol-3-phosphate dehydrogenase [Mycoplasmopsis glycophila]|uniref:Glycerol-3-phosphate dehydrogenase n=1 Tax=Mycoplasmopsis glycophila TaxID=171285 RepID=A0A449AUE8_9BACT|nr:NAD(P)H-dependent glycerol-3-phosphate dehydrogenase [Mycoplasmopsis glycophila]VEU70141.1 glycerol-3-phosphate dehydrogenase [Mycoplasmopsis glycophila]